MFKYLRNKIMGLWIGLFFGLKKADIEMLSTKTQSLEGDGAASEVPIAQEGLLNDLKQGRVTQEVRQLRYKLYLTCLEASKRKITSLSINDFTGAYDVQTSKKYKRRAKGDPFDDYKVEIVLLNNLNSGELIEETAKRIDYETDLEKNQNIQSQTSITIERENIPKFYIENYVDKLFVRNIDGENKLIELYVSEYPDPNNRRTHVLVKELEKLEKDSTLKAQFLDFRLLSFETNNCHGIDDHYSLVYEITDYDKVVKYNGFYIIKLKAVLFDVKDFISEIYEESQAKKYETNEKKEQIYDMGAADKIDKYKENSLLGLLTNKDKIEE